MADRPLPPALDDAALELLVTQLVDGLSEAERRALERYDGVLVGTELRELERAAAAVCLAEASPLQPLPAALRARMQGGAVRRSPRRFAAGWLAAAACLLLAVFGWLRVPPGEPLPAKAASLEAQRSALLARAGTLKLPLAATADPAAAGVRGDVVWDPVQQRGFLHFVGLAPNDPALRQYQLWIFDGQRDPRYPIDGGVFDVGSAGEVIVPIRAALPVRLPKAFAVTVEKPGGVVVSGREHVGVLGQVG